MYRSETRTFRGDHLISEEEVEARKEAEAEARTMRFAQGAAAIERASGGLQGSGEEFRISGGSLDLGAALDDLDARFAELNQRFA